MNCAGSVRRKSISVINTGSQSAETYLRIHTIVAADGEQILPRYLDACIGHIQSVQIQCIPQCHVVDLTVVTVLYVMTYIGQVLIQYSLAKYGVKSSFQHIVLNNPGVFVVEPLEVDNLMAKCSSHGDIDRKSVV